MQSNNTLNSKLLKYGTHDEGLGREMLEKQTPGHGFVQNCVFRDKNSKNL